MDPHMKKHMEQIWWRAFRDGFMGRPNRHVSDFKKVQKQHDHGFSEGQAHRARVDEMCLEYGLEGKYAIDEMLRVVFELHYDKRSTEQTREKYRVWMAAKRDAEHSSEHRGVLD